MRIIDNLSLLTTREPITEHQDYAYWENACINVSLPEIYLNMSEKLTPQALIRIKVSLINWQVAKDQKIGIAEEEIDKVIEDLKTRFGQDEKRMEMFNNHAYKDYLRHSMINNKAVEYLKKLLIEE